MRVQIQAAGDDREAVMDLYRWLRQDPDVGRHATVELAPPRQTGGFMGTVEIINMVLSQGFTAMNLALSYVL